MFVFLLIIHVLICLVLVAVVLMQSGRGEGLSGAFGAGFTQTLFGTASATFLTRATVIVGSLFLLSSLILTLMSGYLNRSLMERAVGAREKIEEPAETSVPKPVESESGKELPAGAAEEVTETRPADEK